MTDTRLDFIKRGAVVGGLVWITPVVQAVSMSPAGAQTTSPTTGPTGPTVPCNQATNSGGAGTTRTTHSLGRTSGAFRFRYNAQSVPDRFDIYYEGAVIYTTGGPVSGTGDVMVNFGPGTSTTIEVVVTGPSGTAWSYTVGCPTP